MTTSRTISFYCFKISYKGATSGKIVNIDNMKSLKNEKISEERNKRIKITETEAVATTIVETKPKQYQNCVECNFSIEYRIYAINNNHTKNMLFTILSIKYFQDAIQPKVVNITTIYIAIHCL